MKKRTFSPLLSVVFSAALLAGCASDDTASSNGSSPEEAQEESNLTPEERAQAEDILRNLGLAPSNVEDVLVSVHEEYGEDVVFIDFEAPTTQEDEDGGVEERDENAPYSVSFYSVDDETFYEATVEAGEYTVDAESIENPLDDVEREFFEYAAIDVLYEVEMLEELAMSPIESFTLTEDDGMLMYTFVHENEIEHEIPV